MYVKDDLGYKRKVKRRAKRPGLLSFVCIMAVLFGFWTIISMFMKVYPGINTLYPAVNALMIVFGFVSISGIWSMEKWGPITFAMVILLKLLVDAIFNQFSSWWLLGFVVAGFFFLYYSKMKRTE
ncbi:MAG TPA: hypothetical protein PKE07_01690 [Lacibacter sp.]|nr:hypothetical protein [Lacibacter sp.]HMO87987.1 hypothetical protein [Lacibacter sp.]